MNLTDFAENHNTDFETMFLPNYTQNELYTNVIRSYNRHKTKSLLHINTPKRVLDRITVNYVRHVLTDYNCNDIDKIEILKLIKNKYTWLEKECNRQIKRVNKSRLCNTSKVLMDKPTLEKKMCFVLANVNFPKIKQFFKVTNVKEEGMLKVDIFLWNEPYLYDDDEMENISKIEHLLPPFKKLTYEEYCSTLRTQFN